MDVRPKEKEMRDIFWSVDFVYRGPKVQHIPCFLNHDLSTKQQYSGIGSHYLRTFSSHRQLWSWLGSEPLKLASSWGSDPATHWPATPVDILLTVVNNVVTYCSVLCSTLVNII